jgi:hypothetical protein
MNRNTHTPRAIRSRRPHLPVLRCPLFGRRKGVSGRSRAGDGAAVEGRCPEDHREGGKCPDMRSGRNQVQLRGMSTHGLQWFPQILNDNAFRALAVDWGSNVVRLALYVTENGYASNPGSRTGSSRGSGSRSSTTCTRSSTGTFFLRETQRERLLARARVLP